MQKKTDRVILGIDPGTTIMGYGLITHTGQSTKLLAMGVLKLSKYDDYAIKLKLIFERTLGLIEEYKPDELAIEAPFFGKNIQSMLKLGRAQGVAMAAALYRNVPIHEYAPKKIKMAVTGNGNASKEQVSRMLQHILGFKEAPEFLDASDGLAVALCHLYQNGIQNSSKQGYSGWSSFLADNPERKM